MRQEFYDLIETIKRKPDMEEFIFMYGLDQYCGSGSPEIRKSIIALFAALQTKQNLKYLDLGSNRLGDFGDDVILALAELIRHLPQLKTLYLTWSNFWSASETACQILANAIGESPNLQVLNLFLDEADAVERKDIFVAALKNNFSLQQVGNIKIPPELEAILVRNCTLWDTYQEAVRVLEKPNKQELTRVKTHLQMAIDRVKDEPSRSAQQVEAQLRIKAFEVDYQLYVRGDAHSLGFRVLNAIKNAMTCSGCLSREKDVLAKRVTTAYAFFQALSNVIKGDGTCLQDFSCIQFLEGDRAQVVFDHALAFINEQALQPGETLSVESRGALLHRGFLFYLQCMIESEKQSLAASPLNGRSSPITSPTTQKYTSALKELGYKLQQPGLLDEIFEKARPYLEQISTWNPKYSQCMQLFNAIAPQPANNLVGLTLNFEQAG